MVVVCLQIQPKGVFVNKPKVHNLIRAFCYSLLLIPLLFLSSNVSTRAKRVILRTRINPPDPGSLFIFAG